MEGQNRPTAATAHGHQGAPAGNAGEAPKVRAGVIAPTEDELRKAKDVVARAKQTNVKLTPGAGGGQARIMLPNGESRAEYIKRRWKEGASRVDIQKEIQSCGGEHAKCTYQVVFSTTKGMPGGPAKAATNGEAKTYSLAPKPAAEPVKEAAE